LGQNENLSPSIDALRVESNGVLIYENLALSYGALNRFDESMATVNQAFTRHLNDAGLHSMIQQIAFARRCPMQKELAWGMESQASKISSWLLRRHRSGGGACQEGP
jgi:hypothetical protein